LHDLDGSQGIDEGTDEKSVRNLAEEIKWEIESNEKSKEIQ
jgi:hypothetical protein